MLTASAKHERILAAANAQRPPPTLPKQLPAGWVGIAKPGETLAGFFEMYCNPQGAFFPLDELAVSSMSSTSRLAAMAVWFAAIICLSTCAGPDRSGRVHTHNRFTSRLEPPRHSRTPKPECWHYVLWS